MATSGSTSGIVYGLSIGDYQAVLAVHKSGRSEVLANENGERETRMIVTYKDRDTVLIGSAGLNSLYRNTLCTAVNMPSLLTSIDHEQVNLNVKVVMKDGVKYYEFPQNDKRLHVSIHDALGKILKQLANTALQLSSTDPIQCILAVPVYYTEQQCTVLKECVESYGFNVLHTAISPALSVLPYGLDKDKFNGHVLVYDIGTQSLTLTILQCIDGLMRVVAMETTDKVGGVYLDEALYDLLKDECKRKFYKDITEGKYVKNKLLLAAEQLKHTLSNQSTGTVYIESLYEGMDFTCNIVRGRFEGICQSIFQCCLDPITRLLEGAQLSINDINKVILIGGTCKIPKLQQLLQDTLPESDICTNILPQHVVALGAAIQGSHHQLVAANNHNIMIPCTTVDIYITCTDNITEPLHDVILRANTPLPTVHCTTLDITVQDVNEPLTLCVREGNETSLIAELEVTPPFVKEITSLELKLIWNCASEGMLSQPILVARQPGSSWKTEISLFCNL